jgi:hypothetical protein
MRQADAHIPVVEEGVQAWLLGRQVELHGYVPGAYSDEYLVIALRLALYTACSCWLVRDGLEIDLAVDDAQVNTSGVSEQAVVDLVKVGQLVAIWQITPKEVGVAHHGEALFSQRELANRPGAKVRVFLLRYHQRRSFS